MNRTDRLGRLVEQDRQFGEKGRPGQTGWGDWFNRTDRLGRLVKQDSQVRDRLGRLVEQDYPVSQDILVIVYYRHILDWIHRVEFLQKPIKKYWH